MCLFLSLNAARLLSRSFILFSSERFRQGYVFVFAAQLLQDDVKCHGFGNVVESHH